jgi:hypothetical protein
VKPVSGFWTVIGSTTPRSSRHSVSVLGRSGRRVGLAAIAMHRPIVCRQW